MIASNDNYKEMLNNVAREFKARVELLRGSTLIQIFTHDGDIVSFTIDREGDNSKCFGFGVCQKLTLKLRDKERKINITKGLKLHISFGVGDEYLYTNPIFTVDEIKRDENTNELTIIGFDTIFEANAILTKEIKLPDEFTLKYIALACAGKLGLPIRFINIRQDLLEMVFSKKQVNITGKESLRDLLDDIAEIMGCVYYINNNWELTFRAYGELREPDMVIDKSKYFTLSVKEVKYLHNVITTNVLGDTNWISAGNASGPTANQYIRDNMFLSLRSNKDVVSIASRIIVAINNMPIANFDCKYRGDFRLEVGDLVEFIRKDGTKFTTIIYNDTITYNGGLSGKIYREDGEKDSIETEETPNTLAGYVSRTNAIIDKVENKITLETARTDNISDQIGKLEVATDSINATVSQTRDNYEAYVEGMNSTINKITEQVSAAITSENLAIAVERTLSDGVNAVTTKTGFTFDSDGLSIHKSGTEMNTQITEDGMTVYRGNTALLTADHRGVDAVNLSASTYLVIGANSRLENFMDGTRTACFWIGQ